MKKNALAILGYGCLVLAIMAIFFRNEGESVNYASVVTPLIFLGAAIGIIDKRLSELEKKK